MARHRNCKYWRVYYSERHAARHKLDASSIMTKKVASSVDNLVPKLSRNDREEPFAERNQLVVMKTWESLQESGKRIVRL